MSYTVIIVIILVAVAIFFISKKRKKAKDPSGLNNQGAANTGEKKDEVWRTIKEFLKNENQKGLEIVSTYSIRRPSLKELHKRLKQALVLEAKQKAKATKSKYVAPKIPKKFQLEAYFEQLEKETFELSERYRQNLDKTLKNNEKEGIHFQKSHRADFINKKKQSKSFSDVFKNINFLFWKKKSFDVNDYVRELYVLIFRTKNSRNKELQPSRAIEVEIIKNNLDKKNTERKIIINKELDLEKEMAWIKPIKDIDDRKAIQEEKRNQRNLEKQIIYEHKKQNSQLWYQKVFPEKTRKAFDKFFKKIKLR